MIGTVILGALAAFGILCALWALLGLLLSERAEGLYLCFCRGSAGEMRLRRFVLLRELGLLGGSLVMIDSTIDSRKQEKIREKYPYITFFTENQWTEAGRKHFGGAGNADAAGDHRSGGLPEL